MRTFTNEEIVSIYQNASITIAEIILQLNELKDKFDQISDYTLDNADPLIEAGESLEKLSKLLAYTITYKDEYEKEPFEPESK